MASAAQTRPNQRRINQGGCQTGGDESYTLRKILSFETPLGYGNRGREITKPKPVPKKPLQRAEIDRQCWLEWLYKVERDDLPKDTLSRSLDGLGVKARKLVLAAIASEQGFSRRIIAEHLDLSRTTVRRHLAAYVSGGVDALLGRKQRLRKTDDESFVKALFGLLHEPPSLSGFNRATWKMDDLRKTLAARGYQVGTAVIRQAVRKAGFRWRSAKVVLTSTDPDYREKLERVQNVLSNLGEDERFFSIDEYGPFAVKAKPGRKLAGPGENPSVPQWQKSKGWLILTAALELSRNQVTHFYSKAKNTAEMIRMSKVLLEEYRDASTLYLSWDAASWHISKKLLAFVDGHNEGKGGRPRIELVPLPASAQFLNVIESVFSGMARAIIHGSDYPTLDAAKAAIDQHFADRNRQFAENPRRAGGKIWGAERTQPNFDLANNCKNPAYR